MRQRKIEKDHRFAGCQVTHSQAAKRASRTARVAWGTLGSAQPRNL